MTDLLKWPFSRKQYPGIDNPRYVSDIVAANQATIAALKALAGLTDTDFAILSGLVYDGGTLTYSPGVYYLEGLFYYIDTPFVAGNYLGKNPTNIMTKAFKDGNSRPIYLQYAGLISPTGGAGFGPVMNGDMNAYRIGSKYLLDNVTTMLGVIASLGGAAFLNVGQVAGSVAAGDDPRLVYTLLQFNDLFAAKADKTGVLNKLAEGTKAVGGAGSTLVTISLGLTLPDNNYKVIITPVSLAGSANQDQMLAPLLRTRTTTEFTVFLAAQIGESFTNVSLDWTVYK